MGTTLPTVSWTPPAVGELRFEEPTGLSPSDAVRRRSRVAAEWLTAIVAFSSLSIVLTWPWATELWHGTVGGDAAQFVWDAWWVRERVLGVDDPWWTNLLYAPEGTYLTAHPLETLLMVLVAPVTVIGGPMVAYGVLVLVTLAAAGVLAWRLGLAMGLGTVGSWVAGLLWASSPIVVYRASSGLYMLLLLAALLPGTLLVALRLMHGFSFKAAVALGVLLGACLLTDLQVTAYLMLAVAAVGVYAVATKPVWRSRAALSRMAAVAAAFLVIGLPVLVMVARTERAGDYGTPTAARVTSATAWNADLAQFLLPSPASRFFADRYARAAGSLGNLGSFAIDSSVALGWATTVLALIGILATRRSRRTWWLASAVLVCTVLSLGPTLKAFGHVYTPLAVDVGEKVSLAAPVDLAPGSAGRQRSPDSGAVHAARRSPAGASRRPRSSGARPAPPDRRNRGCGRSLRAGSCGGSREGARGSARGRAPRPGHPRRSTDRNRGRRAAFVAKRHRSGRITSGLVSCHGPADHPRQAHRGGVHRTTRPDDARAADRAAALSVPPSPAG